MFWFQKILLTIFQVVFDFFECLTKYFSAHSDLEQSNFVQLKEKSKTYLGLKDQLNANNSESL